MVHGDAPADPVQNYPEAGAWREVAQGRCSLSPGCVLEMRVIAIRSGMTQKFTTDGGGSWVEYGSGGRLRLTVNYENLSGDTATATAIVDLAPSPNEDGAEPVTAGGDWGYLLFKYVGNIAPPGVIDGDPVEVAKWSEDVTITMKIEHSGGARVIQAAVSEVPHQHAVAHDESTAVSIHGWPDTLPQLARPQTEAADGATYSEKRFGTARALRVAHRQSQQLGPIIAYASCFGETLAEVTDTEPDPWTVTSTSYVGMSIGSSITTWSSDGPGYAVAGYYSRRNPENLSTRISGAAQIPVRLHVYCRFSAAGSDIATIKFQSTARSWVEFKVEQSVVGDTWGWRTITGWLESMIAPDDPLPNLQDFCRVSGGQFECRYWQIEWGDKAIAT